MGNAIWYIWCIPSVPPRFTIALLITFSGQVIEGQKTLDNLYKEYGDIPPFGKGPDQQKIHNRGNAYVRENFPQVDFIQSCHIVEPPKEEVKPAAAAPPEAQEPVRVEVRDAIFFLLCCIQMYQQARPWLI